MSKTALVGVLFGFYSKPYHTTFLDRLRGTYRVEARHAHGDWGEHIQSLARELVALGPDVLVTLDTPSMTAMTRATTSIPTVALACAVLPGALVAQSDDHLTGFASQDMDARRQFRILSALLETNGRENSPVAVLWNAENPAMKAHLQDIEGEAAACRPEVSLGLAPRQQWIDASVALKGEPSVALPGPPFTAATPVNKCLMEALRGAGTGEPADRFRVRLGLAPVLPGARRLPEPGHCRVFIPGRLCHRLD